MDAPISFEERLILFEPSVALSEWIDTAGLGKVPGLVDGLLAAAPLGLDELKGMNDDAIDAAIASLKLKPGSITSKKLQSALKQLRSTGGGERHARWGELDTIPSTREAASYNAMPPPTRPRLGGLLKAIQGVEHNPQRISGGLFDLAGGVTLPLRSRRHSAPPAPAITACVDSTAEAAELADLATLFRSSEAASIRPDAADAARRAQAKALDLRANRRTAPTRTPSTASRVRSFLARKSSPASKPPTAKFAIPYDDDEPTGAAEELPAEELMPAAAAAAVDGAVEAAEAHGGGSAVKTTRKKLKRGTKGSKSERGTRATSGLESARAPSTARAGGGKRGGAPPGRRARRLSKESKEGGGATGSSVEIVVFADPSPEKRPNHLRPGLTVEDRELVPCAGERKAFVDKENVVCAGERRGLAVNRENIPCAGPRRKGLSTKENVPCAGERPTAKLKSESTVCAGEKPKALTIAKLKGEEAPCAGERKKRLLHEEAACRGEKAVQAAISIADKENIPLAGEKNGALWLADRLTKGAIEVGGE